MGKHGLSPAQGCVWPESWKLKDRAKNRKLGVKFLVIFCREVKWNEKDRVQ